MFFVLALLGVGIVWDVSNYVLWQQQAADLEPALQRVVKLDAQFLAQSEQEGITLTEKTMQDLPQTISFTNRILAQRSFSWSTLLHELEQTVPPGLALKGIQNDFNDSITVRLSGTAVSFELVTAFILALSNHATFFEPQLTHHNEKKEGLVDFSLHVGYRGP